MPTLPARAAEVLAVRIALPIADLDRDLAANPFRFLALADAGDVRVAWRAFDGRTTHVGVGAVREARASGQDALQCAADRVRAVGVRTVDAAGAAVRGRPRWFGGCAFDPSRGSGSAWDGFADGVWFVLPAAQLAVGERTALLTVCGDAADGAGVQAEARRLADGLCAGEWRRRSAGAVWGGESEGDQGTEGTEGTKRTKGTKGTVETDFAGGRAGDSALLERLAGGLGAIAVGVLTKVVVATSRTVAYRRAEWELASLVKRFAAGAPGCTVFLVAPRADVVWLGATPERLVRVRGRRMWTMALAGTARRGSDVRTDRALGDGLLASDKDRREHRAVVDAVVGELASLPGMALDAVPAPRLRRLATLQHLQTTIAGEAAVRLDVLDIARRLHPTPALAGWPRAAALDLIARLEPEGRGWYGGGVGWLDGTGDGDIAVGIRGLLIREGSATAYAGAGLVAGSDAAAEAREIELKLAAAFGPLEAWARSSASTTASAQNGTGGR